MVVQISHSHRTKVQTKSNIQTVPKGFAGDNTNTLQIQRRRNHRRTYDARPCTSAFKYTTKNKCVKFYGILEREISIDDF